MDSKQRSPVIAAALCLVLIGTQFSKSAALFPAPKAISDLKEAIVKGLGFQADDFKISGFDLRDALMGKSVAYEFEVEIDSKILPLKLMEDVNRWEYVDLPIFQMENPVENGALERQRVDDQIPVLAPFQLAGPMELWIQDAKDMRISLPHDVDAGVLKKVILTDGAVVTVMGARSVSLRHPVELPLPLNTTNDGFASSLVTLASRLQDVARSQDGPPLSLRIVGPTSLTSPASSSSNRLKLKRLAPGLVELSSASKKRVVANGAVSAIDLQGESTALLAPDHFSTLWPVVSINGSNSNLLGFEALLASVLGPRAKEEGTFKLLKADVSAQIFVKIGFAVEKKLKEGDLLDSQGFPEWRTKPSTVRMHFEVLAKVDGNKIVPEKVVQVNPMIAEDSVAPNVLSGNITMSKMPILHQPPNPFTL
ncbi:tunicamycin induced protein [Perilla frutescens var. hirtella]|uniref:Tunicamycin induced protein n=1 Tax=Perilla frutescens var. hirtella TaxID=608512 RepID=A0AAD4PBB7_PERFH|nr:tunicamycin induced protein [Perilla frutescens var. hirtella]